MSYMIDFLINWGYWGMFVSAFLACSSRIPRFCLFLRRALAAGKNQGNRQEDKA